MNGDLEDEVVESLSLALTKKVLNFDNMKYLSEASLRLFYILSVSVFISCNGQHTAPSKELISQIDLKRGEIISCGPADKQFGSVDFEMTCNEKVKGVLTLP